MYIFTSVFVSFGTSTTYPVFYTGFVDPIQYSTHSFFTTDGVKQHMDNVHFRHLNAVFGDNPNYVDHKKKSPKLPEEKSRGRKKRKQEGQK